MGSDPQIPAFDDNNIDGGLTPDVMLHVTAL
jgi:hypothetical protein